MTRLFFETYEKITYISGLSLTCVNVRDVPDLISNLFLNFFDFFQNVFNTFILSSQGSILSCVSL